MADIRKILEEEGYVGVRQMKNGEWIGVATEFLYTFGLCIGCAEFSYKRQYCYERILDALNAAKVYEGEGDPIGPWIKVKGMGGERHGPGAKEEV